MEGRIRTKYVARDADVESYPSFNAEGVAWLEVIDGNLVLTFLPDNLEDWPPDEDDFEFYSVDVEDLEPILEGDRG